MKILHTADWHIGSFKGPEKDGENLRSKDTLNCLNEMVNKAKEETPDVVLVSGDIFDRAETWQGRSHREVLQARNVIMELAKISQYVVVMRGTPNHDSQEAFDELKAHFEFTQNVAIITDPTVLRVLNFNIAILPGFDRGPFRAKHPGLSKEDEHQVFTEELSNIVLGLKAQCDPSLTSILMSHYTIPGCNAESGQIMMLTQFEPILPVDTLAAADFDLVAMGHIHRPQQLETVTNCFYSGAINAMNFNDEGQERGFWIHNFNEDVYRKKYVYSNSEFFKTPYREFITYHFTDADITAINTGDIDGVAMNWWRYNNEISGKIVRILYSCSLDNQKALNKAALERTLYKDGAFYVWEILPEKVEEFANRTELSSSRDPEENLIKYLEEKEFPQEKIQELVRKARPIIAKAEANMSASGAHGTFEPVEIEVKNYRNYEAEKFNFDEITFCTINGQNGAGKSSLFMDAIVDCLFEEPREGELTGWIRNDEKARSGSIMFTFRIGEKKFRVTRTRSKSGKPTLNLSEFADGDWQDRSMEKIKDTQDEIINILGMDSLTFKACALIMQDQYGLFLQAQKEERMVILGNLLGLGVYEAMNKLSAEKAHDFGAIKRDLQQEIEIHEATISQQGDPAVLIEEKKKELEAKTAEASGITKERDMKNLELLSLQESKERCEKISSAIKGLDLKMDSLTQNRSSQEAIISSCRSILDTEQMIIEKADKYRELEARKKELMEATTLYNSKQAEIARNRSNVLTVETELSSAKMKLQAEQSRLSIYEDRSGDEEILRKAEEYQQKKTELEDLQKLALSYQEAVQKVKEAESIKTATQKEIEALDENMASKRNFLGKDIALLSSDCGCIDIENAHCKFLEKAKSSQTVLLEEEETYKAKRTALETRLSDNDNAVAAAQEVLNSITYSPEQKAETERICSALFPYLDKAEKVRQKDGEIALIRASIENIQSNISDIEKRLDMAKSEALASEAEAATYQEAFEEDKRVTAEMSNYGSWLESEKQLPVIKERFANANQRLAELDLQKLELEKEITERQAELNSEMMKITGLQDKQEEVDRLNDWISSVERQIKSIQMEIGALTQRGEQIEKLKAEIADLQKKKVEASAETADYDTLKLAFSQDGIPHQIIRTIVPQLESTANNILGQMTGGKMGVTFKTEKVQKNGKEKVALDIFIEEFGKSALPYLSKSGGEKVKASLSVILALAEIKSSSAGIQLGMLFIDEPPFLDSDGIQAYCDALETIQNRYQGIKIMAITHDPTMKARFPQNLDVVKTDQGSKVIYQ